MHPFSSFKASFVNSRAFVGTCTIDDLINFLHVHKAAMMCLYWVNAETGQLQLSYMNVNLVSSKVHMNTIDIKAPISETHENDKYGHLTIAQKTAQFAYEDRYVIVSTFSWTPTRKSCFGHLLKKLFVEIAEQFQVFSLAQMRVHLPLKCLRFAFTRFDKRRHVCDIYLEKEQDRDEYYRLSQGMNNDEQDGVCVRKSFFSPDSLQNACIFFISNYFQNNEEFLKECPYFFKDALNTPQTIVKSAALLKSKIRLDVDGYFGLNPTHQIDEDGDDE